MSDNAHDKIDDIIDDAATHTQTDARSDDAPPIPDPTLPFDDAPTIASGSIRDKKEFIERAIQILEKDETQEFIAMSQSQSTQPTPPPWILQQFFNGEIDLEIELAARFTSTPVMSTVKFRNLGANKGRGVATFSTQDGAAQLVFDAENQTKTVYVSFSLSSMLTLRFKLDGLVDRTRWFESMRRDGDGLAFLWGTARWEQDYVICIARKYYTNFFAFSPNGFEAAARLTPEVAKKLMNWLEAYWQDDEAEDQTPDMLTW